VRAGVPILPGTAGPVADPSAAIAWSSTSQYPIALKAAAGGGGRGFRIAQGPDDLESAFRSAQGEAERAFGDGRLYAERYLARPRHVEVQVFADRHGQVVAIGDRDCSIQRRHQKLIEESPAPNLSGETRKRMAAVSIDLATAVGYVGAGTLEFLVEPDEHFWFLEMNTRIQVEHTVTEEVFGIDLVREQLLVAAGERLSFAEPTPRGHSIQCRINAEDPGRQFAPTPGPVARFVPPLGPGIRVDTAIESGSVISDRYDSMIAKIVATGRDRGEAIARMRRALEETVIDGPPSTLGLQRAVMASDAFQRAELSTAFLGDRPDLIPAPVRTPASTADEPEEWREQIVEVNGRRFSVRIPAGNAHQAKSTVKRMSSRGGAKRRIAVNGAPALLSPLQGSVLRVVRAVGDVVAAGEPVLVLEAMKMENEIVAHRPGRLSELLPAIGAAVRVGDHLFTIQDLET
jgi:acetyl-CoA/propionyl-CoA carboxylase, biotin carboxylase, biotin carboxyl carrier protein